MFVDTAKVLVVAGKGGDGMVSFRHEKYIDKGGPDGGDGGKGGDVVFIGDEGHNTLVDFRYHPELKANSGKSGFKRNQRGRSGEDLLVKVPLGTIIRREGSQIADITVQGQQVIVATGGDGGFGNAHFKSSVRQAPRVAEKGEPGDAFEATLELKLLADVGLVGLPNAGKSTFLSVVTSAKPEIADYAFTTLTPNLGVADIDNSSLLIADIPGLIEGASQGKGLGDAFLRHVERTSVLLHLVDAYQNDIAATYKTIRSELAAYSQELSKRPEVVAITKTEGLDSELITHQLSELQTVVPPETPLMAISSSAHTGLKEVLRELASMVHTAQEEALVDDNEEDGIPTISLSGNDKAKSWLVEKEDDRFIVIGEKIEKFSRRTDYNNVHGLNRLRDIMRRSGIVHELERKGATSNSSIQIGHSGEVFTLQEQ